MRHKYEFAQADVATHEEAARRVRDEAHQQNLMRGAEAGGILPLQDALRRSEEALVDAHAQNAGASLLAERLQAVEAERVAEREVAEAADLRARGAEVAAQNAKEVLAQMETELGRRDARAAALKKSLEAANAELELMRSAKELVAARHELQLASAHQAQLSGS